MAKICKVGPGPVQWDYNFVSRQGDEALSRFINQRHAYEHINVFKEINGRFSSSGQLLSQSSFRQKNTFTHRYIFKSKAAAEAWQLEVLAEKHRLKSLVDHKSIEKQFGIHITFTERYV